MANGGATPGDPTEEPHGASRRDSVDDALLRLTDDQRVADAVQARRREQSLRQQAVESGSFVGMLTDLAERGKPVVVATATGRQLRGTIASLGSDHLSMRLPSGERSLVPTASISAVRSEPGGPSTIGDRDVSGSRTLAALLSDLAVERPRVVVHLLGGEAVAGLLWSAGQDLIAIRAGDDSTSYAALTAIGDLLVT